MVRACTHRETHELRAVKTISKQNFNRTRILNEIAILKAVSGKHPNIITFFEHFEEWDDVNLIFEYCEMGNVHNSLKKNSPVAFSERVVALFTFQLLSGLSLLKDLQILHRDVKPANLLLYTRESVKLSDFGSAAWCQRPIKEVDGSPAFWAPEIYQLPKGLGCSFPVDVWAAGVTMYMMLFNGELPFLEVGTPYEEKLRAGIFEVSWFTSARAKDLMDWLLMPCPDHRISAAEALTHPWFYSHGLGDGSFAKVKPEKLVLDAQKNWGKAKSWM